MNRAPIRLAASLEAAQRVAVRLRSSLVDDQDDLARAVELDESALDHQLLNSLDSFVQRFQQTREQVSRRLFPALYRTLEAKRAPFARLARGCEDDRQRQFLAQCCGNPQQARPRISVVRTGTTVLRDAMRLARTMLDDLSRTETFIVERRLASIND